MRTWAGIVELMTRPQRMTAPIIVLFCLIPGYLVIGYLSRGRALHVPELPLDRMMPVNEGWSIIYLSLFCAALLPIFVLHQQDLIRRTVFAFIFAWIVAFACFMVYPTLGPRPKQFTGDGFFAWTLKEIYSADDPYNCFPSLHVAQCFLAAFAAYCVNRAVGWVAGVWAFLVALSTVYTKQHYVADVIGGTILAAAGYWIFMRSHPRESIPKREQELAPALATCGFAVYGVMVAILWLAYELGGGKIY